MTALFHKLKHHFTFWKIMAGNELQVAFVNRGTNTLFMLGKIIRLGMSLVFLYLIHQRVAQFAGYTTDQVIVFFLTYQFLDTLAQVFYRGVYVFGNDVRSGGFDFYLMRPVSALFRALTGKPDINDVIFIVPQTIISLLIIQNLDLAITQNSTLLFLALLGAGFVIATALHILVLCINVIYVQVDSAIWLYRDITRLGQFPVDIYFELLRFFLFFLVPVGVMFTVPAQVLVGAEPTIPIWVAFAVAAIFLLGSLKLWNFSLRKYASASS